MLQASSTLSKMLAVQSAHAAKTSKRKKKVFFFLDALHSLQTRDAFPAVASSCIPRKDASLLSHRVAKHLHRKASMLRKGQGMLCKHHALVAFPACIKLIAKEKVPFE